MEKKESFKLYAKYAPFLLLLFTLFSFILSIFTKGFILFVVIGTCTSILFFLSLIPYIIVCRRSILWLLVPLFIGELEFAGFVYSHISISGWLEAIVDAINDVFMIPNFIIYLATYAGIAALLEGPFTSEQAVNICEYIGTVIFLATAVLIIINVILNIVNKMKNKKQKTHNASQLLSQQDNNL